MNNTNSAAEYVGINDLKPAPDNPRINDHVVEKVAKSIEKYGFAAPIVAQLDGTILAGHTRWKASKLLGLETIPCRYIDLSGDKARLYRIADNRLSELADWDMELLGRELEELSDNYRLDLNDIGFSDDDIMQHLDIDLQDEEETEPDYDALDSQDFKPGEKFDDGITIEVGRGKIICNCCIEAMKEMEDESIDSIVTDPPYQIDFMGKDWDGEFDSDEWSRQCMRILKPGGHLIAFAATRTIHRIMHSVEKAGFEIRDLISWLYFSGFPKSHNVLVAIDKQLGAEREVIGTKKGVRGADGTGYEKAMPGKAIGVKQVAIDIPITKPSTDEAIKYDGWGSALKPSFEPAVLARKPLEKGLTIAGNVLKHGTGGLNIDACRFGYGDSCWVGPQEGDGGWKGAVGFSNSARQGPSGSGEARPVSGRWPANIYQCAKPSRSERDMGLDDMKGKTAEVKNFHPTVKPVKLMQWLIKLVTPTDGIVLDTFGGSGTTGLAADMAGYEWILIERNHEYCSIMHGRIEGYEKKGG